MYIKSKLSNVILCYVKQTYFTSKPLDQNLIDNFKKVLLVKQQIHHAEHAFPRQEQKTTHEMHSIFHSIEEKLEKKFSNSKENNHLNLPSCNKKKTKKKNQPRSTPHSSEYFKCPWTNV